MASLVFAPARAPARLLLRATGWLYLFTLLWLAAWVLLARLLLGWTPVVITGESMAPRIRAGDIVLLDRPGPDVLLGTSTVVTVSDPAQPERLLTHRVVRALPEGGYQLRGDANPVPDSTPVSAGDVRGVGRLLVPALGRPLASLHRGDLAAPTAWAATTAATSWLLTRRPRPRKETRRPRK